MLDICSKADEKTDVFGLLKISYYSESLQVFISPGWQFAVASCEGKSRMERFYRRHKWHSRMWGTSSVPRRRENTWEGYYECEPLFWEAAKEHWLITWILGFMTLHDLAWRFPTGWSWVREVREESKRDHCLKELKRGHDLFCM